MALVKFFCKFFLFALKLCHFYLFIFEFSDASIRVHKLKRKVLLLNLLRTHLTLKASHLSLNSKFSFACLTANIVVLIAVVLHPSLLLFLDLF